MKRLVACLVLLLGAACDDDGGQKAGVNPAPAGKPWDTLERWGLFADAQQQIPAEGVVPFEVIAPLFADYAAKHRFFWLPSGKTIVYRESGVWDFPVGAIIIKTFGYARDLRDASQGERLLETRLLVHEPGGWVPHTYVWDEAQTTTARKVAGVFIDASWIDAAGVTLQHRYAVPTTNDCQECHGKFPDTALLGLKTAQIDRDGQIERFAAAGAFATAPSGARAPFADPFGSQELSLRARSYLDANCAHCHSQEGDADAKGLYLDFASTAPSEPRTNWGVCKVPTSAGGATCGHVYDVVPGDAETSVMICRMLSTEGADQMPPIGRALPHGEGVALVRAWIDAMEPKGCE